MTSKNAGLSLLMDRVAQSIGGSQQDTNWVIYSCCCNSEEEVFVDKSITRILKEKPQFLSGISSTHMKEILHYFLLVFQQFLKETGIPVRLISIASPPMMTISDGDSAAKCAPLLNFCIFRPPQLIINSLPSLTEALIFKRRCCALKAPAPESVPTPKKAYASVSSPPLNLQGASRTPFQLAPLIDENWEQKAAC
ncbi:hypothetical protein MJO28_009961, partial [Puccinia striiformis f. sp. tritici]